MTTDNEPRVVVTQEDRDAVTAFHNIQIKRIMAGDRTLGDNRDVIEQAFARHRIATEDACREEVARLREALAKARKIIRDIEEYMAHPDRGAWGSECALCMGELFDDDREAIAAIDAALAATTDATGEGK